MRILRVAAVRNNRTGGMSRVMHFTTDELVRAGHEVDYLWSEDLGSTPIPQLGRFIVPMRLPSLVRRKEQQGLPYDVVEIHEPLTAVYCLARRLGARLPPVVAISYGVESRGHRALLAYRRRKQLPTSLKQRYSPLTVTWQADYGLRHSNGVICFNTEDATYLSKRGVPADRIVCTHSGVSSTFLDAGEALTASRTPRRGLLFLATWIERKGILELVPAASRVLRNNSSWQLTIVGCGLGAEAVRQCFPEALRGRVKVIPQVSTDEELIRIYERHSIYILPSYFEGQPLSMLEAAAMGLAIVTTNVCGMRDFVAHGETGLLSAPGDAEELASYLKRLVRDEHETRQLGEAARRKVQALTWKHAAADMLRAYERAVGHLQPLRRAVSRPLAVGC